MGSDLVSVIIGTYNRARFLKESLDSILSQTYQNIEIIVVDDASTDNTEEILEEYSDRIKTVIHDRNIGPAGARNSGISAASGQWIKIHDSDDILEPFAIERIMGFIGTLPSETATNCIITYRYSLIDQDGNPIDGHYPDILPAPVFNSLSRHERNVLLLKQRVVIGTFMTHRRVLEKYGTFDPGLRTVEDIDLAYRFCLHHGVELLCMDDVLRRYRRHATNITRRDNMLMEKKALFSISRRAFSKMDSETQDMYRDMLAESAYGDETLETRLMYMLTYVHPVSPDTYGSFLEYRKTLLDLQSEFDEKSRWADRLDSEVVEKDERITGLQAELDENTRRMNRLDSEVVEKDERIATLQSQFDSLQKERFENSNNVEELKRSIIYGAFMRVARALDRLFPQGTKRGGMFAQTRMALLIYKNEGWASLCINIRHKMVRRKTLRVLLPPAGPPHSTARIRAFRESTQGIDAVPDSRLQKFVLFESHSIQALPSMPRISIIIPTFDQVALLRRNLDAIRSKTTYRNYEIVIVTNNLDEDSPMRRFLATLDCTVCVFEDEYSFASVNNFASSRAGGEFLLFLNDDVEIVSPNWLEWLLKLGLDGRVGAVSGKVLFRDGRLQEAGCIVFNDGNMWNYGRGCDAARPEFNHVRYIDYGSGCCLLVRRDVFDAVGGFDESYRPAYVEDVDLCFKIKRAGLRVLYQPECAIIHHEGRTQGTSTHSGIKSYQITNIRRFYEKWGGWIDDNHADRTGDVHVSRDRRRGLGILYIDHYIPEPDRDSGSVRTFGMLGILANLDSRVTLWPDNLARTEPYCTELQQKGIEVVYGPHDFEEFLSGRSGMYDVAVLSRPHVAAKYINTIRKIMPGCRIIYDTVDLHYRRMHRQRGVKDDVTDREIAAMYDTELSVMRRSDLILLTSNEEEAELANNPDFAGIDFAILSNMHTVLDASPPFESRSGIVFVGGFRHPPNVDAAVLLATRIFPMIKARIPSAVLYIVGSDPPGEVTGLASEDVRVTGYVHDVSEFLLGCRVMAAPLRFGSGVKGKITQGLAYGIPIVTTAVGAEGIGLTDRTDCMIADDPTEFAQRTIALYNDHDVWTGISENGRSVARRHSHEDARVRMIEAISDVLGAEETSVQ